MTANGSSSHLGNGTMNDSSFAPSIEIRDEDTLKILVASDNHLGYSDMNPARENDSFTTFEEILTIAKNEEVDFILLGGDLFHENKPKPSTFQRTMDLLQRHVLGSKPVQFEYLSDPVVDFRSTSTEPQINYVNPNINIGLPILTIHGNHDDPIGGKRTSVVDHLAAANLVNHFGQWSTLHKIDIRPVCLRKGRTQLALYGLGHMKDERLYRLMRDNKVTFLRPEEDRENWFNLFVLHQNHTKHGPKSYFPEEFLPTFLDYVIWGHEHECIKPESELQVGDRRMFILQPGSSVATSLCPGESRKKHVVLLHVNGRNFRSDFIPLETVRPFVWSELILSDILGEFKYSSKVKIRDSAKYVESYLEIHIRGLIEEAARQLSGHPNQPEQPLIRLRIEYEDEADQFNRVRFCQKFAGQIANEDVILFKKKSGGPEDDEAATMSIGAIRDMINNLDSQNVVDLGAHVEEIVERHFAAEKDKVDGQIMEILSDKGLTEAVRCSVDKDDKESISLIVDAQIQATVDHLLRKNNISLDTIEEEIAEFRKARIAKGGLAEEAREILAKRPSQRSVIEESDDDDDNEIEEDDDDDDDRPLQRSKPSTSRAGGVRGRVAGRAGRGKGRGTSPNTSDTSSTTTSRARGRGKGRAKVATDRGGPKTVQTTLPVRRIPASNKPPSSSMQFDDDSD